MQRQTVGLVCADTLVDRARFVISEARLDVQWIAHSFGVAKLSLDRTVPSIVVAELDVDCLGFWSFLEHAAGASPRPTLLVLGAPGAREAFRLARAGVDAYFESFDGADLTDCGAGRAFETSESLEAAARNNIGRIGVKEAQKAVRVEMFREALRRERGNRHAVARLLGVDRKYVLKMLKENAGLTKA